MTNRTFQFRGIGYGAEPASITAVVNGQTIYNGTIPTVNTPPNTEQSDVVNIFTWNSNIGSMDSYIEPASFTVNSGVVKFASSRTNFCKLRNPAFSAEQIAVLENPASTQSQRVAVKASVASPPFTAEEIAFLESTDPANEAAQTALLRSHGAAHYVSTGADGFGFLFPQGQERASVAIDGVPQTTDPEQFPEAQGTWWWNVSAGSTITFTWTVEAGLEY